MAVLGGYLRVAGAGSARFSYIVGFVEGGNAVVDLAHNMRSKAPSSSSIRGLAAASTQHHYEFDEPAAGVIFAVTGTGALPSATLTRPTGEVITEANAASFPGVVYAESVADSMALLYVDEVAAGTWMLAETALPAGSATFEVYAPVPPSEVSFTSVENLGGFVTVGVEVAASDPEATLSLYYSSLADGSIEGLIMPDMPAGFGAFTVGWDTSEVASGSYFVVAIAEDSFNPPVTAVHATPVLVDDGLLLPPTGLQGTRSGNQVSLSWTPSPSDGVAGYMVFYCDDLSRPDHPLRATSMGDTSALVSGLDPAKSYRFVVQAYDQEGATSVESEPWISGPRLRRRLSGSP